MHPARIAPLFLLLPVVAQTAAKVDEHRWLLFVRSNFA